MKRIICAALALTLLGSTAASAHDWGGHGGYYGGYRHHHGGDVVLGVGLGLLALGAIAAASDHDRYYRDRDGYYDQGRDYRDREYRGGDGYDNRGDDRGYDRNRDYRDQGNQDGYYDRNQ